MQQRSLLVVGGAGALGRSVISAFKPAGWRVASIDPRAAPGADLQLDLLVSEDASVAETQVQRLRTWAPRLDAVVHVAGGFEPGEVDAGMGPVKRMWTLNGESAFSAAFFASQLLDERGVLVLTGAQAVRAGPTGFAVGYGMSKAAVLHLAMDVKQCMPQHVVCMLPQTIDTPANRKAMPDADFSTWSQPADIAQRILGWAEAPPARDADIFVPV